MTKKSMFDKERENLYAELCEMFIKYAERGYTYDEMREDISSAIDAVGWKG